MKLLILKTWSNQGRKTLYILWILWVKYMYENSPKSASLYSIYMYTLLPKDTWNNVMKNRPIKKYRRKTGKNAWWGNTLIICSYYSVGYSRNVYGACTMGCRHLLNKEKQWRMLWLRYKELLHQLQSGYKEFRYRVITTDGTWIFCYDIWSFFFMNIKYDFI